MNRIVSFQIVSSSTCRCLSVLVVLGICRQGVRKALFVGDAMSALHLLCSSLRDHYHIMKSRPGSYLAPSLLCFQIPASHSSTLVDRARLCEGDHPWIGNGLTNVSSC
jgi:hypothetical protein